MSPTRLPHAPAARLAEVGRATIEYIASGTSPPTIVLVNGAGGPLDGWSRVFGPLLRYGMVVAHNRPGIGRSSRPTEPQTGALIVGTLRDLLTVIEAPPPYLLLGHSLGGLYVQLFARRLPEDVCGVVMVEAAHPDDRALAEFQPGWTRALTSVLQIGNPLRRDRGFDETRMVDDTCRQIEHAPPFPDVPLAVVTAARPPPSRKMPEEVADASFGEPGGPGRPRPGQPAVPRGRFEPLPAAERAHHHRGRRSLGHRTNAKGRAGADRVERRRTATDHASTGFWTLMEPRTTSMVTFDTELGRCAVRWSEAGINGVLLPKAGGRPGPSIRGRRGRARLRGRRRSRASSP